MAETNTTNVQAIITNLEGIIGTTLGFNLEYEIKDDPDVDTTPAAILHYLGESFEDSLGERPKYNEVSFMIIVVFRESDTDEIRDRSTIYVHKLRDGITTAKLNVGDLSESKQVTWVDHLSAEVTTETPTIQIDYQIAVRYREI